MYICLIFLNSPGKQNELLSVINSTDPFAKFSWDQTSITALENAYKTEYTPECAPIPNTDVSLYNLFYIDLHVNMFSNLKMNIIFYRKIFHNAVYVWLHVTDIYSTSYNILK